jgi:hypothetical protein
MLNQNDSLIDRLESLINNISYVVTLNLMGEIVSEHYRDNITKDMDGEKILKGIRKIVTTASLLNFDNVKFLMYEENNHKNLIINVHETSVIIGLCKYASEAVALSVLSKVLSQTALSRV